MNKLLIKSKIKAKLAFTLAEVLISLAIIGVIAALVVPSLQGYIQDKAFETALKKVAAILSAATQRVISENGGTFKGISSYMTEYPKYLNVSKICNNSGRTEGCWHPLNSAGGTWRMLDGATTDGNGAGAGLILNDGVLINLYINNICTGNNAGFYTKSITCGWIIVDVNGFKSPNITGKDIFYFHLLENKLEPWGSLNSNGQTCNGAGWNCTAPKLLN